MKCHWVHLIVLALAALPITGGVLSASAQDQLTPFGEQDIPQIWQPAPTPHGGLSWQTLIDVEVNQQEIDNFVQYVPTFTPLLQSLDGKTVKINGYMVPLDAAKRQSHFILMAYPHACPFHMPGGPGGFIEIEADFPVEFTYEPILIEGHFQLLTDFSMGLFYRITAARALPSE